MKQYLDALKTILADGIDVPDRTGTGTRSYFSIPLRFDMNAGFPACTTKKLYWRSVVAELLWFLSGSRRLVDLQDMGCHIWDANVNNRSWRDAASPGGPAFPGDVGRAYGVAWRHWQGVERFGYEGSVADGWEHPGLDQIHNLVNGLKADPFDRRHIVTAWNPSDKYRTALPPCHILFQCHVQPIDMHGEPRREGNPYTCRLNLGMYQRSCDMFLGVPFNIASYALLLHLIARDCGMLPGTLVITLGDAHIYNNHRAQVTEQLTREPMVLPQLEIGNVPPIVDLLGMTGAELAPLVDEFMLLHYDCHPAIRAEMSI